MERKKQKKQDRIKQERQRRIDEGLPAKELKAARVGKSLNGLMHQVIEINNNKEGFEKDYSDKINEILKEISEKYPNRPIIFAPNHVRMQDIEVEMEAIPCHQVLLSGDFENVYGDPSGIMLGLNGVLYFDMEDVYQREDLKKDREYIEELKEYIALLSERDEDASALISELNRAQLDYEREIKKLIDDRKNIRHVITDMLNHGYNLLWYYEGTWCYSEKNPYNDGSFFIVEAAVNTNAIVLPVIFDMIDHKKAVLRYGKPIDYRAIYGNRKLTTEEKIEGLDILKGEIGRVLMEIWDEYSFVERESLAKQYPKKPEDYFEPHEYGNLHGYWEEYLKKILSEWKFSLADLKKKRFVDKTKVEQKDAFEHLHNLDYKKGTAFLFKRGNHY